MRISDLLSARKAEKAAYPPRPPRETEPEVLTLPALKPRPVSAAPPAQNPAPLPLPSDPTSFAAAHVRPTEIYARLIHVSRELALGLDQSPARFPDLDEVCEILDWIIRGLEEHPARLLELVERSTPEDYLVGHTANVVILSLALGREMLWTQETLRAVGLGALLHDAGLVPYRPIYSQNALLRPEEKEKMKIYPVEGLRLLAPFLDRLAPEPRQLVEAILLQAKERISGQGFPKGLKGGQIRPEAQAVGLCDTYESQTHPRAYRGRILPHEALRRLIEFSGETFDGGLIKKLWETLTLFPPGSFVRLSTGEVARVADLNRKSPTQPVVRVLFSPAGEKLREEKTLDLSQVPGVSVEKAVDECALKLADRRLLLELRAQKWWFW